jgi:dihydrofolate reductase
MVPYWPEVARSTTDRPEDIAFAKAITPIPKIVLSHTLKNAGENTSIVSNDPEALIRQLKQQPGKKIVLSSAILLPEMLRLGLIDELYLVVHPILVGDKKRLFENFCSPEKQNFKLTASRPFRSGAIALHYQKND